MVPAVSSESAGSTSMEAKPSVPFEASYTSRSASAASPTSLIAISSKIWSLVWPASICCLMSSSYWPLLTALAKMVGLLVSPRIPWPMSRQGVPC